MTDPQLPVKGYVGQPPENVALVNKNKELEEQVLQVLDGLKDNREVDGRWLAIGRTHIELAFMAINRSIFKPTRINTNG